MVPGSWIIMVWVVLAEAEPAQLQPPDLLPPAPPGQKWRLLWHDEFEGTQLNRQQWDIPQGPRRDGFWTARAVLLDGKGHLVIRVFEEGGKYYDACVRTRGKFEYTFGFYVARIQLQRQPGHWSAFWLHTDSVNKIGNEGRDGTEIDIMEKPWLDDRVNHALHWDGYGKHHRSAVQVSKVPGIMEGFHTFALDWRPEEYVFYIDGKEVWRTRAGGVCQVPVYIKLSDEVGRWAGDIRTARLPDQFLVDYVRVYELVDAQTGQPVLKPLPLSR